MKKTVLLVIVACAIIVNFSFVGTRVSQVQAQSQSFLDTIISSVISFVSNIFGDDDENRTPEPKGSQDCHDELIYYYKRIINADGTFQDVQVGSMEVKLGNRLNNPPEDFTYSKQVYYKKNNHHERLDCSGAVTSSPCTSRLLTCEEQNR